jgi:hypothetical protein
MRRKSIFFSFTKLTPHTTPLIYNMLAILHDDSAELIVAGICETFKWQVVV